MTTTASPTHTGFPAPWIVRSFGVLTALAITGCPAATPPDAAPTPTSPAPTPAEPAAPAPAQQAPQFRDRAMLAEVNGDGVLDIIGRSGRPGAMYIAAYDGNNGAQLWRTADLGEAVEDDAAIRGVILDHVLSADASGLVQAYMLRTGALSWSLRLDLPVTGICEKDGMIVLKDGPGLGTRIAPKYGTGYDPAVGELREGLVRDPCTLVPVSDPRVSPDYQRVGWFEFEEVGLPDVLDIPGIITLSALVPTQDGPRFLIGESEHVAAVAAFSKRKIVWKQSVPAVDPRTVVPTSGIEDMAALGAGHLVIPYELKGSEAGVRLTCLSAAKGERLWDIHVPQRYASSAGITLTSDRVYYSSRGALYVLSLKTGELQFRIGEEG